jgi:hypothetical protein
VARLGARLDDIERTTTRELFAATVFLSPLLLDGLKRLVEEMVAVHERWIDERIREAEAVAAQRRADHSPALSLLEAVRQSERQLTQLVETQAR